MSTAEKEIFHIVVNPPVAIDPGMLERMAVILGQEIYRTRLLLSGRVPKIIAQCQTPESAEVMVQKIKNIGVSVFMCKDSELRKPLQPLFAGHSLKKSNTGIIFTDHSGQQKTIKFEDVYLVLVGTREKHVIETSTSTSLKLNLPATLVTGGIPVFRRVKEEKEQASEQVERFIRIYGRISLDPIVEILQFGFDYSFLGNKITVSSFLNLNTTADELKKTFTQAFFDDKLNEYSDSDLMSDQFEINCRLIYLSHYPDILN